MPYFGPQVRPQPIQPLDFSSIGNAFASLDARKRADEQLAMQQQQIDIAQADATQRAEAHAADLAQRGFVSGDTLGDDIRQAPMPGIQVAQPAAPTFAGPTAPDQGFVRRPMPGGATDQGFQVSQDGPLSPALAQPARAPQPTAVMRLMAAQPAAPAAPADPVSDTFRRLRSSMGAPQKVAMPDGSTTYYDPARVAMRSMAPELAKEGLALERLAGERSRRRADLLAAGMSPNVVDAALDNPSLQDNYFFPKPTAKATKDEQIQTRIKELVGKGVKLDDANKQARLEFGETNPKESTTADPVKLNNILSLQGHFNNDRSFTQAQDIASAYAKIRTAAKGEHTATSDMSLIYGLMKLQDPGSTVREGEYASAQNAKGVPDQIKNLYNKVMDGAILSDRQREQFLQTAEGVARAHQKVFSGTIKRYSDIATRRGVDPRDVVYDPFEELFDAPQASGTSGASGTTAKPSLQERARQLKAQGMSRDAAMQQMAKEGYDLKGGD